MSVNKIERNIKAERVRNNFTQEQMAKFLGISINAYTLKERGIRQFTLDEFRVIMKVLNCSADDLI